MTIDSELQGWLAKQHVFFVATAPLGREGHVNCSPKGGDSFAADRDGMEVWATKKGPTGVAEYRAKKNRTSIDGLPGVASGAPT